MLSTEEDLWANCLQLYGQCLLSLLSVNAHRVLKMREDRQVEVNPSNTSDVFYGKC